MNSIKSYIGLFTISLTALSLEIILIRLFSISHSHNFAFMVVSISLFGMAIAGTALSTFRISRNLYLHSILFALSSFFSFIFFNYISFDPYYAMADFSHLLILPLYYITLGTPFFFFGAIVAIFFSEHKDQSGKVYFFNMAGSAFGSFFSIAVISILNTQAIVVIPALGLISSLFFAKNDKKRVTTQVSSSLCSSKSIFL